MIRELVTRCGDGEEELEDEEAILNFDHARVTRMILCVMNYYYYYYYDSHDFRRRGGENFFLMQD